jgi:hypothetical protein
VEILDFSAESAAASDLALNLAGDHACDEALVLSWLKLAFVANTMSVEGRAKASVIGCPPIDGLHE